MAVIVTVTGAETEEGGVYNPLEEIVPVGGESDHVTAWFVVPLIVAVNCRVFGGTTVLCDGDMDTVIVGAVVTAETTELGWDIFAAASYALTRT